MRDPGDAGIDRRSIAIGAFRNVDLNTAVQHVPEEAGAVEHVALVAARIEERDDDVEQIGAHEGLGWGGHGKGYGQTLTAPELDW